MQCCQWKNKSFIINPPYLCNVLKSRRAVKVLIRLLPLFDKDIVIKTTYDKLARSLGYSNRGGAYKAIKVLERLGVVSYCNGYLHLTMGNRGIILSNDE